MNPRGHVGFNLLITSMFAYLLGLRGLYVNSIIILSSALSTLPDIDIRLRIAHRKYTHNIFFGTIIALGIGYLTYLLGAGFGLGFWSIFTAVSTHLLADMMTYRGFNPIAPIGKRNLSLKLFKSSNKVINNSFLIAGSVAYLLYLSFTTTPYP